MKKLLSIICTLAIVLGVVLVPGMFSASAAGAVTVVKTSGSVTEADGVYTIAGNYKDGYFYTDFKMEAGKTYNLSMNCDVSAYQNNGGVRIFATTLSDGTTNPTAASKVKALVFSKKVGTRYLRAWNFTADELLEDGFEYLAIKVNTMDAGTDYTLSDIRVVEVKNGDYLDIVGLEEQAYIYADDEGYENALSVNWYGRHYFTYDYEIDPNKNYLIQYEYKGKNGIDGGTQWIWQASSDKDPADGTLPANTVGVKHPVGNVDVANYTAYAVACKGSQLGADATHKYLTMRGNSVVSKPCYFRKVTVTELSNDYIYELYVGNDVKSGIEENIPYWTNGGYTGNSTYALNYKLEAGKYYAITADIKGTNKVDGGFRWSAGAVKDPKSNAVTRPSKYVALTDIPYQNEMPWLTTTSVIAADDIIDTANGLEYLALVNNTHTHTYIRNIKVQEVSFADGYIYPVRTGSETAKSYDDAMSWASVQSYGGISLVFDYTIEADKMYTISYDYHGHNWTGNAADGLRLGLVDLTEVPADRAFAHVKSYWNDAKIVKMSVPSNKTGFTAASTTFKGSDLIDAEKTGRVKLAICGQGYPADNWSNAQNLPTFRNFKIEVLSPADYSAVDKAIEDAGKLDKNAYKDFSGVDAAIAAVVRDKLSSEQAAVDAMAKAINDAIAALEAKEADYSAVDAAIAAAEALNPGDYNNWYNVARAIYAVKRDLGFDQQATIDGYAKAINDAIAALDEDDKYDYPINLGSDINITNKISVEDGTGDIVYSVPGSYGYKATLYFDVEMKAGKYYSITFNYKGDGKGAKGEWRVVGAADNWNGVNTITQYDALPNYRSQALPRIDKTAADMTEWGTVGMIVKADALISGDNKFIAISNGTTDNGDALVKNITIKEVTLPEGVLYPAALSYNAKLAWEDGLVVGQFGGEDPSQISSYGYSYGRVFVAYDYTIDANKTYTITFDYKGHNYSDVGKLPYFGVAKLDGIGTGEDPASYVRSVNAGVPTSKTAWVPVSKTVTGAELLAGAPEGANKFMVHMGGMISGANFRNLKIAEYVAPTDADYTAVDAAIAAANALTKANYVDFSAVDAAIAAVVRGKTVDEQAAVDAMAKAITDAIDALVMKGADYTAVNNAKAAAEALDKNLYKDFSAVDAAIAAIVTGKEIDEQDEVDAMATAINNAVAALEFKDADYSEIEELDNLLHTMNGTLYTDATVQAVRNALNAIEDGKNITEQTQVDAWADALRAAIDALEKKPADYSAVDAAIAAAEALDADDYTNYDDVEAAIDAVEEGKKIDEQDEVDAWAQAITDAIDALIEKADYSEIDEIEAQYPDFNPADYTEESLAALYAVIEKIEANNNLPATEQDKVDELAEEFAAALKALVRKPAQDGGNSSTGSTGNNTTEKAPDKTGDSSNIFVAIIAMVVSVLGLAVLVIAKKRRA